MWRQDRKRPESPSESESASRKGRVITFYSYKGGTGRSMALANVAWLLAMSGSRVLVVDWDLEAPGLHRYFHPFIEDKELQNTQGLLDYVEKLAGNSAISSAPLAEESVDIFEFIEPLEWPRNTDVEITWKQFPPRGRIDILTAGRQSSAYARKLAKFNWIDFYERLHGRRLLNAAKARLQSIYDYVLIDSRTGVSDTSGICTAELPDTLVICFTLNHQSIVGASAIAKSVLDLRGRRTNDEPTSSFLPPPPAPLPRIQILPVPTRVEITSERDKLRIGLETARMTFAPYFDLPQGVSESRYWGNIQMAYFPFYAFEEIPAVFGDSPNQLLSLSTSIKQLTRILTNNEVSDFPALDKDEQVAERLRQKIVGWYLRRSASAPSDAVAIAQEIFERLTPERQSATLSTLTRLVQLGERGALVPRSVSMRDVGERASVLYPFVDAKIVTLTDTGGTQTVAFADPTLVENWLTFREWVHTHWQALILRQSVGAAMESWKLGERDEELLLQQGKLLADAEMRIKSDDFNDAEREFIQLSSRAAQKSKRSAAVEPSKRPAMFLGISWVRWGVGGVLVLLLGGLAGGYGIFRQKRVAREQARADKILAAVKEHRDSDPLTASLLLLQLGEEEPAGIFRELAEDLTRRQEFPAAVLERTQTRALQFNRDGRLLAIVAEDRTDVLEVATQSVERVPSDDSKILAAAFDNWYPSLTKKGSTARLVTVSEDRKIRIWPLAKLGRAAPLRTIDASDSCSARNAEPRAPRDVRFSADERTILVQYNDAHIALFDVETGKCIVRNDALRGQSRALSAKGGVFVRDALPGQSSALSPGGGVFVRASENGRAERFLLVGQQLTPTVYDIGALGLGVRAVNCSGDRLVFDPMLDVSFAFHTSSGNRSILAGQVVLAAFDCRDGLLTAESDAGAALLYQFADSRAPSRTYRHRPSIVALALDADGTRAATASEESVCIWERDRKLPPRGASWTQLTDYLRVHARGCLSGEQRVKYLGESLVIAEQRASDCKAQLTQSTPASGGAHRASVQSPGQK